MLRSAVMVALALTVSGCLEMSPAQVAASVQTAQCEHYVKVLTAGRDADLSCVDARAAAEKAEPMCALTVKCPGEK